MGAIESGTISEWSCVSCSVDWNVSHLWQIFNPGTWMKLTQVFKVWYFVWLLQGGASCLQEMTGDSHENLQIFPWDRFLANSKIPQGQTDELLLWISKVHQKKKGINMRKHSDYRKQAMLANALVCAQNHLRLKQRDRLEKWQVLKRGSNTRMIDSTPLILSRPDFCDEESGALKESEESRAVDNFLSSLSSGTSKRKIDDDNVSSRKRCKAWNLNCFKRLWKKRNIFVNEVEFINCSVTLFSAWFVDCARIPGRTVVVCRVPTRSLTQWLPR